MSQEIIQNTLGLRPLEEALADEANTETEDLFGIEDETLPVEVSDDNTGIAVPEVEEDDENFKDLSAARKNVENLIKEGDSALKELITLAKQGENIRAFEATSTLMKTLLDANKDFVEISNRKQYLKDEKNSPKEAAQNNVTNNNLIISTADLLRMMKGEKDE